MISFGRACIDEYYLVSGSSLESKKSPILDHHVAGGGQAATSAVVVSILGGKSAYVGNLGLDSFGMEILKEFKRFGVDTRWVNRYPELSTPKALILVNEENGDRTIYYEPSAKKSSVGISKDCFENVKCLILDPEISIQDLDFVMEHKDKETLIIYDAERQRPALAKMMEVADFFIASETILDIEEGVSRKKKFEELKEKVQGEFIITFGEKGAFWVRGEQVLHVSAFLDVKTLDTTGAGDVYHASFAYFYPRLIDIEKTMLHASYCAAVSTQYLGTRHQMPFFEGLESGIGSLKVKDIAVSTFCKNYLAE